MTIPVRQCRIPPGSGAEAAVRMKARAMEIRISILHDVKIFIGMIQKRMNSKINGPYIALAMRIFFIRIPVTNSPPSIRVVPMSNAVL